MQILVINKNTINFMLLFIKFISCFLYVFNIIIIKINNKITETYTEISIATFKNAHSRFQSLKGVMSCFQKRCTIIWIILLNKYLYYIPIISNIRNKHKS
jgi:hypothetical protein